MLRRTRALRDPVTIHLDGKAIPAERGEPLAVALAASDVVTLARSPKLHRPRGPSCLRGGCDGCLARVNGAPNVMTCLRPAHGGERIEVQNVVGSRRADLLRVTDWFFPKGIDHHHLMAGIPGLSDVMQSFASKVAGLGRLPTEVEAPHGAARCDVDVAVIGAGPAGIAVASRLAGHGLQVALIDDGLSLGGGLAAAPDRAVELLAAHPLEGVEVLSQHVAAGVYLGEILAAGEEGATVLRARAKVFATGAHDGTVAVPNNDLPGVFSARALCRLLAHGVEPTGPVVLAGDGFWADELAARLGDRLAARAPLAALSAIKGSAAVKGAVLHEEGADAGDGSPGPAKGQGRTVKAVVVAIAAEGAPSFEVAAQAGAAIRHDARFGYAVAADARGRAGDGVWAVGECTGGPLDLMAIAEAARLVAEDIEEQLPALGARSAAR